MIITIDEQFKQLIPPLTADEFAQLEKNLLSEGCRENLIVWNDILVDGHNRHAICTKHGIPYQVTQKAFESREAVILWMIDNQLGRRSLSTYDKSLLGIRRTEIMRSQAKENLKKGGEYVQSLKISPKNQPLQKSEKAPILPINSTLEAAKIADVSCDTISKVKYIEDKADDEVKSLLRTGEMTVNAAYQSIKREERIKVGISYGDTLQRRISIYPNLRHFKMHIANSFDQATNKGKLAEIILRTHYDAMPAQKQDKLIAIFDKMTPEQIEHTADLGRRE